MSDMPPASASLPMFIIDVLRYDVEQVSSIVTLLNAGGGIGWRDLWPRDFTVSDVAPALNELLRQGFIRTFQSNETGEELIPADDVGDIRLNIDALWFELTKSGWEAWEEWDPPGTS